MRKDNVNAHDDNYRSHFPINLAETRIIRSMCVVLLWLLCVTALSMHSAAGQGLYSIIAPNTLRPNSHYHIAVSIHKSTEPVKVKLGILGSTYSEFKTVEVRPFSSELVHFEIPALKSDRYNLTAEGLSGMLFTNETQLHFDAKQFTIMLQTDKAIYRPGDLVRYRILLLDSNLKPAHNYERVHLEIRDSGNNIIKRYQDIRFTNAVYSNELQLSEYPKMGEWSINVEVMGQKHQRSFEVMEYILPSFVVDIDTAKHVVFKDTKLRATIKANYVFGKPIDGEATLSIYPTFFGSLQPFVNDLITRKVVPMKNGQAYFEFDIKDELKLKEDYEREYLLDALVEEKLTGSVQNASSIITVHLDAFRIEPIQLPPYYIPGVPFEVTTRLVRNDGTLLKEFKPEIKAYLTNEYDSSEMYNRTVYSFDSRGEVKMKFSVPVTDKGNYLSVVTDYLGIITDVGKIPRKHLHSKNYITAKILTDKPSVNQEVTIAVRCNAPIKNFIYHIVGRGDIIISRSVDTGEDTYHTTKFLATFAMMPRAKLFIYTVINGEFVYDEQTIQLEEMLANSVQIDAPLKAPPGQDIDITISTKPYSYIGLMIVDQNAANIKMGNDLTHERLMNALYDYELSDVNTPISSPGKTSGVTIMSNADFIIEKESETAPLGRPLISEYEDKAIALRKTDIGPAHQIEVNTLAPGKGRYAFSYTPKPLWHNPRIYLRHNVDDTWLFLNISAGSDGRIALHRRLPSTMTSWSVSAFALDPVTGLGLLKQSGHSLQAYKDFYITTSLPYSMRLGETIALPFVVFNNKNSDLDVDVTLYNTARELEFLSLTSKSENAPKVELYSRRVVRVLAHSVKSVAFIVTPKRSGPIAIKTVASSQLAGDTLEATLMVEHPGATEIVNRGFLFELSSSAQLKENVTIRIPRNALPDSTSVQISAVGDVVGSIIGNIERLILPPTGCGEQAMVQFLPNILVLRHLQRIKQLSSPIEQRTKKNLEIGYQHLLYYRHINGAFSAFGLSEQNGSTWLTAYAATAFRQAAQYTQIDEHIIQTALAYLANTQGINGAFEERGDIFEQFDDQNVTLTAFVVLAFIENVGLYVEYKNHISKALDYIARGLSSTTDLHAMAMGTYALSRGRHNARGAFLQQLDAMAINEGGKKWWNKSAPASESSSPWYNRTRSLNIEISSYAVLALLENNLIPETLPVLKWMMDQRNDLGGFVASQDTVVGLQALFTFAEHFSTQSTNVQIGFHYGQSAETILNVNAENALVLQSYELPNTVKNVTISATGRGMAIAQLTYKYNTNVTSAWPRFVLDPTVNHNSHSDYLHLSVCASFVSTPGGRERSNMAVMEVYLPSGFVINTDTLPTLESSNRIKKVEIQRDKTVVVIYFDYLDRREVCPTLHAYKTIKVTNHKPVPVIMYDYYDNVKRARQFYNAPKSFVCDICEDANCGSLCEKAEKRASSDKENTSSMGESSSALHSRLALSNVLVIFFIIQIMSAA